MSDAALHWDEVGFSVPHGFWMTPKTIIENLSMIVSKGSVLGLVGPNGAGKTTTIKLGAGLLKPKSGNVFIFGSPAIDPKSRRKIGLLTETQYIYPHLKLREWLLMLAGFSGLKGGKKAEHVEAVLDLVKLGDRSGQMMHTLSKGQLQRAGFAQAMVHDPEILILDEPMSGLDPYWRFRFHQILTGFKEKGGTILFSSHILSDVERLSDRIALLEAGKLVWIGRLSDMPRHLKGYEVICRADHADVVKRLAPEGDIRLQPGGEWRFSIPADRKEAVMKIASDPAATIEIESLRPIYEEVEEVLFSFTRRENA